MSIKLMSQVWECQVTHREQALLLALADHADDEGRNVFPSVEYLEWKTDYDERTIQRIMKDLRRRGVLTVERKSGYKRPTNYRINLSALPRKEKYVRKGDKRSPYIQYADEADDTTKGDILTPFENGGVTVPTPKGVNLNAKGDKITEKGDTAVSHESSIKPSKKHNESSVVVAVDIDGGLNEGQKAREFLRSFGIGGANLNKLAALVSPEIASEWALYARHTDKPREMVQGICFNSLVSDPLAPPPCSPADLEQWRLEETQATERAAAQAEYERKVATGEIQPDPEPVRVRAQKESAAIQGTDLAAHNLWQAALAELQLQMTKATFDTWVKPTFAISWNAVSAKLVVGVNNAYAKQWLANRLNGMIERTLNHCHGAPVTVEFLLRSRETAEEIA